MLEPILEHQAEGAVKKRYDKLKAALKTPHLPLFFTYIGPFPSYLDYISEQIIEIISDPKFTRLNRNFSSEVQSLIHEMIPPDQEVVSWLSRYRNTPSFANLQGELNDVFSTNMTIALIFVALRESVKGWAVAAKPLPSHIEVMKKESAQMDEKDFILEGFADISSTLVKNETAMVASSSAIEPNMFAKYLHVQHEKFFHVLKQEQYLYLRVYVEQLILATLPILPHPLVSPINVVLELASKYKQFPDLLYLLSEHFPTYAVQRMIFSGYML